MLLNMVWVISKANSKTANKEALSVVNELRSAGIKVLASTSSLANNPFLNDLSSITFFIFGNKPFATVLKFLVGTLKIKVL